MNYKFTFVQNGNEILFFFLKDRECFSREIVKKFQFIVQGPSFKSETFLLNSNHTNVYEAIKAL